MPKHKQKNGFTLIEILVVIAIIALLTSIVMVALRKQNDSARTTRLIADFRQIQTQVDVSRLQNNKTVFQITGNGCSDCAFRDGASIQSHTVDLVTLNTSWKNLGFAASPRDPWGNPYMLDENEQESGTSDCRYDQVWSGGPNGTDNAAGTDDVPYNLTHFVCP